MLSRPAGADTVAANRVGREQMSENPVRNNISALSGALGAEIHGVDLSSLDDAQKSAIRDAFHDHLVLVFRDQDLSVEQHIAFGRRFGELHIHPASADYQNSGNLPPEILLIHADENTYRVAGDKWHTDVSCDPEPPRNPEWSPCR